MLIRVKEKRDCPIWVDINIKGWTDNLVGVVSDRVLKLISDNRDNRIERDLNNFKVDDNFYVLEDDDQVIGILKIKESDREGFSGYGEVQALYLDLSKKGNGYGRMLVNHAFDVLKSRGYSKVVIGCLDGNKSNEFYKHIGGKYIRQDVFSLFDEDYLENVYEYNIG